MPSPFPGMDPYLEERSLWPDVHSTLISYIRESLQPQVRPKYIARIGERVELANVTKQQYIPDVSVVEPPNNPERAVAGAGVCVVDEPLTVDIVLEDRNVPYIEIIYRETGDVVTAIEVLSPVNKSGDGQKAYIKKQNDLIFSETNLVEIDLLGYGQETTLVRKAEISTPPEWRYNITLRRAHSNAKFQVYVFNLQDRLPRCRIPLRAADPDVALDLPTVFARCYDVGSYDLLIDYAQKPPVPLDEKETEWLETYLKEQGLRSG